jgi:Zyg-11 family protein
MTSTRNDCYFQLFAFKRIVLIMLKLIRPPSAHEDFVQGIAIYLLNSLACQVDGSEKQLVGDLGAVDVSTICVSSSPDRTR